jgi:Protein of unknown function (DUF3363)
VISRAYISQGFRERARERVTLELGPRSEREIRSALEREVDAERWTNLDRALRDAADAGGGVVDLRPGAPSEDPELRRLMIARAAKLERLGLAEREAPACWTLKPGVENTLRQLAIRGDIIKTMHHAVLRAGRDPDVSGSRSTASTRPNRCSAGSSPAASTTNWQGPPMRSSRVSMGGLIMSVSPTLNSPATPCQAPLSRYAATKMPATANGCRLRRDPICRSKPNSRPAGPPGLIGSCLPASRLVERGLPAAAEQRFSR